MQSIRVRLTLLAIGLLVIVGVFIVAISSRPQASTLDNPVATCGYRENIGSLRTMAGTDHGCVDTKGATNATYTKLLESEFAPCNPTGSSTCNKDQTSGNYKFTAQCYSKNIPNTPPSEFLGPVFCDVVISELTQKSPTTSPAPTGATIDISVEGNKRMKFPINCGTANQKMLRSIVINNIEYATKVRCTYTDEQAKQKPPYYPQIDALLAPPDDFSYVVPINNGKNEIAVRPGNQQAVLKVRKPAACGISSFIIPFISRAKAQSNQNCGAIQGTVSDKQGNKVPGLHILAYHNDPAKALEAITDKNGFYKIGGLENTSYRILIDGSNPYTYADIQSVPPSGVTHNFLYQRSSFFFGKVTDSSGKPLTYKNGQPLNEVYVKVNDLTDTKSWFEKASTDGTYKTELLDPDHSFELSLYSKEETDRYNYDSVRITEKKPTVNGTEANLSVKPKNITVTTSSRTRDEYTSPPIKFHVKNPGATTLETKITPFELSVESQLVEFSFYQRDNPGWRIVDESGSPVEQYKEIMDISNYISPGYIVFSVTDAIRFKHSLLWPSGQQIQLGICTKLLCSGNTKEVIKRLQYLGIEVSAISKVSAILNIPKTQDGFKVNIWGSKGNIPGTLPEIETGTSKAPSVKDPYPATMGDGVDIKSGTYVLEDTASTTLCTTIQSGNKTNKILLVDAKVIISTKLTIPPNNFEIKGFPKNYKLNLDQAKMAGRC